MYLSFKPVEEEKRYIFIYFLISLLEARKKKKGKGKGSEKYNKMVEKINSKYDHNKCEQNKWTSYETEIVRSDKNSNKI